jgi:hypothetical protein
MAARTGYPSTCTAARHRRAEPCRFGIVWIPPYAGMMEWEEISGREFNVFLDRILGACPVDRFDAFPFKAKLDNPAVRARIDPQGGSGALECIVRSTGKAQHLAFAHAG